MKKYLAPFLVFSILLWANSIFAFWGLPGRIDGSNFDKALEKLQNTFERWSKILGISVDKIKDYWAEGLRPKEIIEKEGISTEKVRENMKNLRLENLKEFLQKLVDKGIITKEQMEKRLQFEQQQMENCQKCKFLKHGFGRGSWRW